MALNSGLKTVKDILADIKTLTSKDEFHTGTHVLLAKTKAGKFAGSITWITSTDKKLINTKRVGTDVYNAHSLNFFMILREEEINIAYQSLTRFISDVQSPEFDKAVRMGSLPDWTGFIPILIRTTNTVHQDLVKYLREFFAGLPEREDLVWEYAYEPPLDKPLIALPIHAYKYWGNKFLNSMVEHIARESPKDRLVFTLMATNPLTKTNLLLSFIITNQPNPDNGTIAYADKASGVTIYLSCGTSDPRWFMVIFKSFVWALCNDRALTYPTLKDRVKALADPSGANSEKLMHYLEEFFKMFGFQLPKVSDIETLHWDFLYGTYSETWSWFVDEQFNPLSKNTLPKEKEHDVSDQNLIEKISESIENKALPGAMWFALVASEIKESSVAVRTLTFMVTIRPHDRSAVHNSITWVNSTDFVLAVNKVNLPALMTTLYSFLNKLMAARGDSEPASYIRQISEYTGMDPSIFNSKLDEFFKGVKNPVDLKWAYKCDTNDLRTFRLYLDSQNSLLERQIQQSSDCLDIETTPKRAGGQLVDQINSVNYPLGGYNPHDVLKEQIGIREYACCALGAFKNAKVYFVDSLKGLRQLEADLKRTDLVKTERRDMEQWFDYPEPRGKTIRLNNFDSVIVLHYSECEYLSGWRNTAHSVIAHEALHVVLSLCKCIGYNPLNEQEPAAYAMEFITLEALGYYLPRMERISE